MEPATIAAQLRELAMYYELDGDRHRAFAYDRAAKSVESAAGLQQLIAEGRSVVFIVAVAGYRHGLRRVGKR